MEQRVNPSAAMQAVFAQQQAQSRTQPVVPWEMRADRLRRLRNLVRDNRVALAEAISKDFGHRSRHETELLEINHVLDGIQTSLRHGRRWMHTAARRPGYKYWPGRAQLVPQPVGVVGIVVPWNYPLDLSLGPANSAMVAGNRVMLKLSELTPVFGELLASLVTVHFSEEELCVINGDADVSRAFCRLPFDHLLFTGSTAVGHDVMRAASDNLTPVTLELGGKSPAIFGPGEMSAPRFAALVARMMMGKSFNAGQTCVAPDHAYVPRPRMAEFVAAARAAVTRAYPALGTTADYTRIISPRHFERLTRMVEEAVARGATAVPLSDAKNDSGKRLFAPVLLIDAPQECAALREEIFGPVLPVIPYDRLTDVIAAVNARPRPLALYVYDHDEDNVSQILANTVSGGVTVNDLFLHVGTDSLPFGGVGPSGMGAYHGRAGFDTFSHLKPVFRQGRMSLMSWLYPPYGRLIERFLGMPRGR